jgi:hypothetical protein
MLETKQLRLLASRAFALALLALEDHDMPAATTLTERAIALLDAAEHAPPLVPELIPASESAGI